MAVAVLAVAMTAATRFLASRIAALLRRLASFYPAPFLRPILALGPLVVARRVIPVCPLFLSALRRAAFKPVHLLLAAPPAIKGTLLVVAVRPLHRRTVLAPAILLSVAGRAK